MNKAYKFLPALALVLSVNYATASEIDNVLNNTVQLTAKVGSQSVSSVLLYQADGTIQNTSNEVSGSWEISGDELCTSLEAPGGQGMQKACSPLAAVKGTKVGDKWSFSPSGAITLEGELLAGR